jgi:hypothetical protein
MARSSSTAAKKQPPLVNRARWWFQTRFESQSSTDKK